MPRGHVVHALPRYTVVTPLCWRDMDGRWVVFRNGPPTVCELDSLGAAVLCIVEEATMTASDVTTAIVGYAECPLDDDLAGRVNEALRWLVLVGLIEATDG